MKNIKEQWKDVCNEYLKLFAKKHEFSLDDNDSYNWVGGDPGTIATPGDYFIGMDTIRYDIDNNVPEELFLKWYDYSLELSELEVNNVNYESYIKGARPYDEAELANIRELKKKVWEAERLLEDSINTLKYGKKD